MSDWNSLDRLIAAVRYRAIDKFMPGGIVCDIGCGQSADFLKQHSAVFEKGYGFDFRVIDQEFDNIVIRNNRGMRGVPLPNDSCDGVFLLAVLEHLEEPTALMMEIARILKPGGCFVMTTPTRLAKPILEFMAFRLHIINEEEIQEHKHYYTLDEIRSLLSNAGLVCIHHRKFSFGVNRLAVAGKPAAGDGSLED